MILSKGQMILAAVIVYLMVMAAGAAAYFVISKQPPAEPPAQTASTAKAKKEKPELTEAQKKEQAEKEAQEKAKAERRQQREKDMENLAKGMRQKIEGVVTTYSYRHDEKEPGVHLWVALEVGDGMVLDMDVLYYYTIHDPIASAWIFGDHLDIEADGIITTLSFDPTKRQKKVASDAEWLSERYTLRARKEAVEALRKVGNAGSASITYYQEGGKSRTQSLTSEEIQEIHNMVTLYDLYQEEQKDDGW